MTGLLTVYFYISLMVGFCWLIRRRDDGKGQG